MHGKIVREARAAAANHFSMSLDGIHGASALGPRL